MWPRCNLHHLDHLLGCVKKCQFFFWVSLPSGQEEWQSSALPSFAFRGGMLQQFESIACNRRLVPCPSNPEHAKRQGTHHSLVRFPLNPLEISCLLQVSRSPGLHVSRSPGLRVSGSPGLQVFRSRSLPCMALYRSS